MPEPSRTKLWRRALIGASLLAGAILLVLAYRMVDLHQAVETLGRIGGVGLLAFFLDVTVIFAGPAIGWHLLLRSEGIPVSFRQTMTSALMGRAFNMISPFMYFGGEGVRTFHVARVAGVPRRRVLATIIAGEFQLLLGVTLMMLLGCGVIAATGTGWGRWIWIAFLGAGVMAAFVALLIGLFLGTSGPTVRLIELLIRCRIFPRSLQTLRTAALDMESTVRDIFMRRRRSFLGAFLLTLLSPLCHFLEPFLFYLLLARPGTGLTLPTLAELSLFFVLSQALFILPITPGGIGIYEGGMIGIFRLLGRPAHDGAAFGLIIRLDDFLYLVIGAILIVHLGTNYVLRAQEGKDHDETADGPSHVPVASSPDPLEKSGER